MLDVSIYVLNKDIGKVEWCKKFEDYKIGYIMIGVLIIVKDKEIGCVMLIYGLLGDEFGVVGKFYVCDVDMGEEIWMCFFVEGYKGNLEGKESIVIGDLVVLSWFNNFDGSKVEVWNYGGGVLW